MNPHKSTYMSVERFYAGLKIPPQSHLINEPYISPPEYSQQEIPALKASWSKTENTNTADPNLWGPAFWFSIHNGASKYPVNASPVCAQKMKGFILGMPYILPCDNCSDHARNYIASREKDLDNICSSRRNLFAFFVDMHNMVNNRFNKPIITVDQAYNIYSGSASVEKFSFGT